jgi:hypothetical protein
MQIQTSGYRLRSSRTTETKTTFYGGIFYILSTSGKLIPWGINLVENEVSFVQEVFDSYCKSCSKFKRLLRTALRSVKKAFKLIFIYGTPGEECKTNDICRRSGCNLIKFASISLPRTYTVYTCTGVTNTSKLDLYLYDAQTLVVFIPASDFSTFTEVANYVVSYVLERLPEIRSLVKTVKNDIALTLVDSVFLSLIFLTLIMEVILFVPLTFLIFTLSALKLLGFDRKIAERIIKFPHLNYRNLREILNLLYHAGSLSFIITAIIGLLSTLCYPSLFKLIIYTGLAISSLPLFQTARRKIRIG